MPDYQKMCPSSCHGPAQRPAEPSLIETFASNAFLAEQIQTPAQNTAFLDLDGVAGA